MKDDFAVKSEPQVTQDAEISQQPKWRVSSEETERPRSTQPPQDDAAEKSEPSSDSEEAESEEEEEEEDGEEDSDPAERLASFDWNSLHERYHQAINDCQHREDELTQEWESLMAVLTQQHHLITDLRLTAYTVLSDLGQLRTRA